jgi:hypothetical protein
VQERDGILPWRLVMEEMERDGIRVVRTGSHRCSELLEFRIQTRLHAKPVVVVGPVIADGRDVVFWGPVLPVRLVQVHGVAGETDLQRGIRHELRVDVDLEWLGRVAKCDVEVEDIISIRIRWT